MLFSSGRYALRPINQKDLRWAMDLHNDPEVLSMLTDPTRVTWEKQQYWFDRLQESETSKRIVVLYKSERVGLIRLDQIDPNNRSICVGLDIEKTFRGFGHAKKIYRILLSTLFKTGTNRVWLQVADYNERAFNLYTKLGFVIEGRQRQALFKNNKFYDYITMSILAGEYEG